MAEALLNAKGKGRFQAESAGSQPAAQVNPYAIETLRAHGISWAGHPPRSLDGLEREPWDCVITVCDRAKQSCPIFPGQPPLAHWGMPDPAEVEGDEARKRAAFRDAFLLLRRRIDVLLALPLDKLERRGAVPAGDSDRGTPHPSAYPRAARLGGGGWVPVLRHALYRGGVAAPAAPGRPTPERRERVGDRRARGRRALLRASHGRVAPRHQAREHPLLAGPSDRR